MVKYIAILLLAALNTNAQTFDFDDIAFISHNKQTAIPTSSYLVSEDCEGTGTPSGWTNSGTVNWDYAELPLIGNESVTLLPLSSTFSTFSPQNEVWVYAMLKYTTNISANTGVLTIQNSSGTRVAAAMLNSSGTWRVYSGGSNVSGGSHAVNTTYHVWLRYIIGTGSDSVAHLYISTTSTRPDTPTISRTIGDATTQADRISISGSSATLLIFDKIRISTTEIRSNPQ